MLSKKNRLILNCILIFSILTLSIAYFIEYVLGFKPCNLCLIERYPYLGAIILISLIFIINRFEKSILTIVLIMFVFGAIVSFYHVGIEQGFFEESFVCNIGTNENSLSSEDLLKQLEKNTIVSCKDVDFRFLGLSLATINTVISLILSAILTKIILNYEKNE